MVTREDNCNQTAENNCWQENPYLEQTLQRLARWQSAALAWPEHQANRPLSFQRRWKEPHTRGASQVPELSQLS